MYSYGVEYFLDYDQHPLSFITKVKIMSNDLWRWAFCKQPVRFVVKAVKVSENYGRLLISWVVVNILNEQIECFLIWLQNWFWFWRMYNVLKDGAYFWEKVSISHGVKLYAHVSGNVWGLHVKHRLRVCSSIGCPDVCTETYIWPLKVLKCMKERTASILRWSRGHPCSMGVTTILDLAPEATAMRFVINCTLRPPRCWSRIF